MINVSKTFLPPLEEYYEYLKGIWERNHITNHGPLVLELEEKLKSYLGVKHVFLVNNGTIALQIAIKALSLKKKVITTPFSYVATTSTIIWEGCTPVFSDIDNTFFCLDPNCIEEKIDQDTEAIMATHVYGNTCDVEVLKKIAEKCNLKIIYDAAHAFGVNYKGKSILNYGDIATLSFHATKLFHTIEGGAVVTNDDELAHKISYMRNFGHKGAEAFWGIGINGKSSEVNAAMGLCLLPIVDELISQRKQVADHYNKNLENLPIRTLTIRPETDYNYAYYPVVFSSESCLINVKEGLMKQNIVPRRYFYPSLNTLPYLPSYEFMPIAEEISKRVLCLPMYPDLPLEEVNRICNIIKEKVG